MNELIEALKRAQASTFVLYLKTHNYHWNVEGDDFPMYHDFFKKLYDELHDAVDIIAELIRTLDEYAPGSLREIASWTSVQDETVVPVTNVMISNLFRDNQIVINELMNTYRLAEKFSEFGISNAIQTRIESHKKHAWMLRSMTKGDE